MENTSKTHQREQAESWPALPFEAWKDTCETLHMWTQIVGKVRMELSPFVNHWWHVTLYVTPRGLTTSPIPYRGSTFDVDFDFIDHTLFIRTSEGTSKHRAYASRRCLRTRSTGPMNRRAASSRGRISVSK